MIFTSKNGELRLYDSHPTPYYLQVLFTQANLSFPLKRGKPEELLNMDRGNMDSNASYSQGSDEPIMNPLPVKFSGKIDDTTYSHKLVRILGGVTKLSASTEAITVQSTKGDSTVNIGGTAFSTPAFADTSKICYNLEVKYEGTTDFIYQLKEVYFPPDQQTITESENGLVLEANGLWYGSGGTISIFSTGKSLV
jgi:hypothetical protein